ncbi:MAG: hypothetical protein ACLGRW_16640 [Acidobacteriota bacterium]|jgi:hypothetical protein
MMKFDEFLRSREHEEKKRSEQEATAAAEQQLVAQQVTKAWRDLQDAVKATADGKEYKGVAFKWRADKNLPPCLVLHNLAASFIEQSRAAGAFTVQFGGIPGNEAYWKFGPPESEYLDVQYLGPDRWRIGFSSSALRTTGDDSAAHEICAAFVRYYDNFQRNRRGN